MIDQNSHINYSLKDIEKYLKGMMSAAEMHELEKAALQDPFLSDAIEGYREISMQTAHQHLQEIKNEILPGKKETKVVFLPAAEPLKWWRMVAIILIIATVSAVTWKFTRQNNKQESIAENKNAVILKDSLARSLTKKNNTSKGNTASLNKSLQPSQNEKAVGANKPNGPEKRGKAKPNGTLEKAIASRDISSDKNLKQDFPAPIPSSRQDSTLPISSSLASKEIANTPLIVTKHLNQDHIAKDEMALQGRVAGVAITKSKSKQGSENMMIRGSASNSSKNPLYVIDGIVYDSLPPEINPSVIKSLNVLKDARATALYGAKGANGAVVISTNLKNKTLQGRIVNQNGEGIAGATLTIQPKNQNLTTDAKGNFKINTFDSTAVASISSIGYQPLQSVLKANQQNRIVLKDNQNLLDEVVVIGYGTQKRKSITGAVSSIASNKSFLKAEMPMPDGGWDNYKVYLANKIFDSTKAIVNGPIEFEFILNKSREARHIRILQSPNKNKNSQIIEAVKKGPKWTVSEKNKKQKVSFTF